VLPRLQDDALILDQFADADVAAHLAGEDEETARRFGWWPESSTEATVRAAFTRWAQEWQAGGATRAFAARERATGELVGGCELRLQDAGRAEVSYWTSAGRRGGGYATRALRLLLGYAWSIGVTSAESHVATGNLASRRVSEKAGLRPAGTFLSDDGTLMVRYRTGPGDGQEHLTERMG
jgi:RimJ/RimL family protein N-acetyltransferase